MNPVYSMEKSRAVNAGNLTVLVVDTRICLLDSLSHAIGDDSDIEVVKASSVEEFGERAQGQVAGSRVNSNTRGAAGFRGSAEGQSIDLILYCIGASRQESVTKDIAYLSEQFTDASVVLVSERLEGWSASLMESNEIAGIVPASFSTNQLVQCLKLIHSGVAFMPVEYRSILARQGGADDQLSARLDKKLTPRQREVLRYVSLGKSNKYIAAELSLCESTVKVHVHEVMKRLGATSRTHASYIVNNLYRSDSVGESESAVV